MSRAFWFLVVSATSGVYACDEVGAKVVIAWCGELQVQRDGNISRFDVLRTVLPRSLFMERRVLLSEMQGRDEAQGQIGVQAHFT